MPAPLTASALASLSSFSSHLFGWLVDLAGAAVAVSTALALVVVVVLLVLRAPPVRERIRCRLQRKGEVPWYLSWLAGTALHVEAFKGSDGAGDPEAVHAVLSAQLSGAGVRRPLAGVDLATTPYRTGSVLEDIGEAVKGLPRGKALAALIKLAQKLLPRYDLYVQGYLLQSPERGSGLVLNIISDAGQVNSSGTLWADILEPYSDPPPVSGEAPTPPATPPRTPSAAPEGKPAGDVLRLALAGAVWVQYRLLEETRQVDSRHVRTLQWRSAALFEVAVHDEGSRDHRGLRALYALALDRDPGNLPALFNLAVLELHDGCTPLACSRLRALLDALAQEAQAQAGQTGNGESDAERETPPAGRDPLFYQAQYTLAVARQTLSLETATSPPASVEAADFDGDGALRLYRAAGELERDIERTQKEVEAGGNGCSSSTELRTLQDARERLETLLRIEGPVLVMIAIRRLGEIDEPTFELMGDPTDGGRLAHEPFSRRQLVETLRSWQDGESGTDPDGHPNPQTLAFGHIAGEDPEASYRTHYNRACYATCVAQKLGAPVKIADWRARQAPAARPISAGQTGADAAEDGREPAKEYQEALRWALAKLECALEPGDLVGWAALDPALHYLQEAEPDAFNAVLSRYASSQPAPQNDLVARGQR